MLKKFIIIIINWLLFMGKQPADELSQEWRATELLKHQRAQDKAQGVIR